MIAAALLALSLSHGAPVQSDKLDQLAQPAAEQASAASKAVSVILDCQIAAKALTDCKAINEVADATVVAEAIRMAGVVAIPDALADSGARIRIRMNVAP
jgi:methylmalonyl-CoA mutase cobalamin-binding subunit